MVVSIGTCLKEIGIVDFKVLKDCESLNEEFQIIKKSYFMKARETHPDKGGSDEQFRKVNDSFEVLRRKFNAGRIKSFLSSVSQSADSEYQETSSQNFAARSWDFYEEAEETDVPGYRAEKAKSARSKCAQRTKIGKKCSGDDVFINIGEIRIGTLDLYSGSYGRFVHIKCWRVPSKIWLGLPNPEECSDEKKFDEALLRMSDVTLSGYSALSWEERLLIITHVMNSNNWAKLQHRKTKRTALPIAYGENVKPKNEADFPQQIPHLQDSVAIGNHSSNQIAVKKEKFQMPLVSSKNKNFLDGKTIVLTGLFPEVGGGTGLNVGKDKVKQMVQAFGGRVTSSVSGKTDILLVGKHPGFSKVNSARSQKNCKLLTLSDLSLGLETANMVAIENPLPVVIDDFSVGYMGRSNLALEASKEELDVVKGLVPPPLEIKAPRGMKRKDEIQRKKSTRQKMPKTSKNTVISDEDDD